MDISAPQEEELLISEERDTYMAEDMDYIDDQLVIGCGNRQPELNTFWRTIINFFP